MPFSATNSLGKTYFLNKKEVTLKYGGKSIAYYFSKEVTPYTIDEVPEGREVYESPMSHIFMLKSNKPKGEPHV